MPHEPIFDIEQPCPKSKGKLMTPMHETQKPQNLKMPEEVTRLTQNLYNPAALLTLVYEG